MSDIIETLRHDLEALREAGAISQSALDEFDAAIFSARCAPVAEEQADMAPDAQRRASVTRHQADQPPRHPRADV